MQKSGFSAIDKAADIEKLFSYLCKFESLLTVQKYRAKNHKLLKLVSDDQILEVGCGSGYNASQLAKIVTNGKIVAVDNSHHLLTYAKQHYSNLTCIPRGLPRYIEGKV